ncbi:MAG: GDP-fucose synthetase [Geminicoccus sp.]|nr:GDP-fucose synthetase [Geminicoccus sp.]
MVFDLAGKSVFIAGHNGMVGGAVLRLLKQRGDVRLITASRRQLDLRDEHAVGAFFTNHRPDACVLAAARVGGIIANSANKVGFLYDNLRLQNAVIGAARASDTERLLFLGSSCIYPKLADQPIREDSLLTGPLEPTNDAYAIAKIAGLKLCEFLNREEGRAYISAQPCNLYGPGDNYHPTTSHVIPGLIRRFHEAKHSRASETFIWGTGTPLREFLYVDDLAKALVFLLENYKDPGLINVGSGEEISIGDLAGLVAEAVGYEGVLKLDPSKPDGTPRKLMDSSKIRSYGWRSRTSLQEGLRHAYADYLSVIEA